MKTILLFSLLLTAILWGCGSNKSYTEEDLGIRKSSLYNENLSLPKVEYPANAPGSSKVMERAFENAPPMIPHSTQGLTPIKMGTNMCINCHMPAVAKSMGATPLPKSHFTNLRKGKKGKYLGKLAGARYDCLLCHARQAKVNPLVQSKFKKVFRKAQSAKKSNLMDVYQDGN